MLCCIITTGRRWKNITRTPLGLLDLTSLITWPAAAKRRGQDLANFITSATTAMRQSYSLYRMYLNSASSFYNSCTKPLSNAVAELVGDVAQDAHTCVLWKRTLFSDTCHSIPILFTRNSCWVHCQFTLEISSENQRNSDVFAHT